MKNLTFLTAQARLSAALWPLQLVERIWGFVLLALALLNGLGLALILRYVPLPSAQHTQVYQGVNLVLAFFLIGKDFFPGYRRLATPLPNFYPVTQLARLSQLLVIDVLSLSTIYITTFSFAFYAVSAVWGAALHWLLLALISLGSSFNVRFQLSLPRVSFVGIVMSVLPLLLAFSQWYLPPVVPAYGRWASLVGAMLMVGISMLWESQQLRPTQQSPAARRVANSSRSAFQQVLAVYLPKAGTSLVLALTLKALLLLANYARLVHHGTFLFGSDWLFYGALSPMISFNYINNNTLGHIYGLSRSELERIGLTARQWQNYVHGITLAVVLDILIALIAINTLPKMHAGTLAGLYFLSLLGCVTTGYAGSLLQARKVDKVISLSNFRPNTSLLVNAVTTGLCLSVFKFPSFGLLATVAVGALVGLAVLLLLTLQHNAMLGRRLWQQLL